MAAFQSHTAVPPNEDTSRLHRLSNCAAKAAPSSVTEDSVSESPNHSTRPGPTRSGDGSEAGVAPGMLASTGGAGLDDRGSGETRASVAHPSAPSAVATTARTRRAAPPLAAPGRVRRAGDGNQVDRGATPDPWVVQRPYPVRLCPSMSPRPNSQDPRWLGRAATAVEALCAALMPTVSSHRSAPRRTASR